MSRQEQQRDAAVLVDHDTLVAKSDPRSLRRSHPPLLRAVGAYDPPVVAGRECGLRRSVLVVSAFLCGSSHCPCSLMPLLTLMRVKTSQLRISALAGWSIFRTRAWTIFPPTVLCGRRPGAALARPCGWPGVRGRASARRGLAIQTTPAHE